MSARTTFAIAAIASQGDFALARYWAACTDTPLPAKFNKMLDALNASNGINL